MKVSTLIYQLQKYNPNAELYYVDRNNKKTKMFDVQTYDNVEGDKVSITRRETIDYLSEY